MQFLAVLFFVALASSEAIFANHGKVDAISADAISAFLKTTGPAQDMELVFRGISEHEVVHTARFDQIHNGLPVLGGEIAVHITPSTLEVHGLTFNLLTKAPAVEEAVELAKDIADVLIARGHATFKLLARPSLTYVMDSKGRATLAWNVTVLSNKDSSAMSNQTEIPEPYNIYIQATSHKVLMEIPIFRKALNRKVYDTHNSQTLPGTLVRSEGQSAVSDVSSNEAYDNAGRCYFFYKNVFNRDSYDGKGAPLLSTVHYGVKYNNAFWNGNQMVYGDGDDIIFSDFANDLSVICHELSHAVTSSTSNLQYFAESGALNEGFSDIMGASSVVYNDDPKDFPDPATAWIIGPNVTLINLNPSGCPDCPLGLRYMDNPTLDGSSKDYYPERYTGFQDNRGVHWNSGIANLAFVLTTQGGTHPRQKTSVFVEAIGMSKAQNVYYVANTQYAISSTNFAGFKVACGQAAAQLGFNKDDTDSVNNAWAAVGV